MTHDNNMLLSFLSPFDITIDVPFLLFCYFRRKNEVRAQWNMLVNIYLQCNNDNNNVDDYQLI